MCLNMSLTSAVIAKKALTSSKKLLCGLSVVDSNLQDLIVDWVSKASVPKSSARNGRGSRLMRNAHLILFDSHTRTLPLKFLARCPTSMVLLEATQHSAYVQREFVAKYLAHQQNKLRNGSQLLSAPDLDDFLPSDAEDSKSTSSNEMTASGSSTPNENTSSESPEISTTPTLLLAYHSSFKDLLVPSKSKPYNERFLKTIFVPDLEYFSQAGVEPDQVRTVAFGCLPSPALQRALLNSLFIQWVVHVHNQIQKEMDNVSGYNDYGKRSDATNDTTRSVFDVTNFTLITLLHSTTFAQIICGKYDPIIQTERSEADYSKVVLTWHDATASFAKSSEESNVSRSISDRKNKAKEMGTERPLAFYAKSHLHYSFMFNVLFEVELLNGWNGFEISSSFSPIPPDFKETSHVEKLEKVGIKRNHFYAVSVRPRKIDELSALMEALDIDLRMDLEDLLRVTFWLIDFTTKFRGTKPFNLELRRLLNSEDVEPLFDENRLVNEVPPHEFLAKFANIREFIADESSSEIGQRYAAFRNQFLKNSVRSYVD